MRQKVRRILLIVFLVLFPVTLNYFSPYLIINGAFEGVITGSFLLFCSLFVGSLLLGRAFCGWVCPAGGLQEVCFPLNRKRVSGRFINWIKYIIWVPWLAAIVLGAVMAGGFRTVDPLYLTDYGVSVSSLPSLVLFSGIVIVFVALSWIFGKRAACHSVCWIAPFMVLGNRLGRLLHIPSLHLEAEPSRCVGCKACDSKCPMSLQVSAMVAKGSMRDDECILCGQCVDTCAKKAVCYRFGAPVRQAASLPEGEAL
jgi:ferredoxin-type protein NapH